MPCLHSVSAAYLHVDTFTVPWSMTHRRQSAFVMRTSPPCPVPPGLWTPVCCLFDITTAACNFRRVYRIQQWNSHIIQNCAILLHGLSGFRCSAAPITWFFLTWLSLFITTPKRTTHLSFYRSLQSGNGMIRVFERMTWNNLPRLHDLGVNSGGDRPKIRVSQRSSVLFFRPRT